MDANSWVQGWIQNRGKTLVMTAGRLDADSTCWWCQTQVHLSIQTKNIRHVHCLCVHKGPLQGETMIKAWKKKLNLHIQFFIILKILIIIVIL